MKLFFAPGSCARVPLIALEEIGEPFEIEIVAFVRGDHKSPDYLKKNPKGKVPTLELTDGHILTENVAILTYFAKAFPKAKLLPFGDSAYENAKLIADLAWCSSGLHPIVTRLRVPQFFCDTQEGRKRVWEMAAEAMKPNFEIIENRLAHAPWMLGEVWSIIDAYVFWVWFRVEGAGFDISSFPRFADHARRMEDRPAVKRALSREREAYVWLEERGLTVNFSTFGTKNTRDVKN